MSAADHAAQPVAVVLLRAVLARLARSAATAFAELAFLTRFLTSALCIVQRHLTSARKGIDSIRRR